MSRMADEYKKLMPNKLRINHQTKIKSLLYKENETDLKIKKIANLLYSDIFHEILLISKTQFIKSIEKKLDKIILDHFTEYITIKKAYILNLKKEIKNKYINEYSLLKNTLNNYNKNPKNFQFVTYFTPHCPMCEKYAYHNCLSSLTHGKFIEIKNSKNDFVICIECKMCYNGELIEMYCKFCKKNYYSSIIDKNKNTLNNNNIQKKLPFATWEKYHCGFIINEIMKCIKCKSNFYYDNMNNKLICLNKKCKFEAKPKSIIWKCSICSSEFTSSVKAFNPLEIKVYKNSINYALIIREKARPYKVIFCNFCGGDISKATFYHKKDCDGELLMSKLNNKEVVVCSRCHGMNFYSQNSWFCPLCDRKIRMKNYINYRSNDYYFNYSTKTSNYNKNNKKENAFSQDNEKIINDYQHLKLYKKKNLNRKSFSTITYVISNDLKKTDEKKNNLLKYETNIINNEKNNTRIKKKNSLFTINNLFMRNDSEEKYTKTAINFKRDNSLNNNKPINSKSLEKTLKKKTTLFDILQKRYNDQTYSISNDKKKVIKNNLTASNSINNINKSNKSNNTLNHFNSHNINNKSNNTLNTLNTLDNNIVYNNKKIAPYSFSLKNKFLRNKTEKNINGNILKQNNFNSENINKNDLIKKIIYQKNVGSKINDLNKVKTIEVKKEKEKLNHVYKSIRNVNNIKVKEYSLNNREKESQLENKIDNKFKMKNKIREKLEKNNENKTLYKTIKSEKIEKDNINNDNDNDRKNELIKEAKNIKNGFNRFFRKSLNQLTISNNNKKLSNISYNNGIKYNLKYSKLVKNNKQNNTKLVNKKILYEEEKNNKNQIQTEKDVETNFILKCSKTAEDFKDNKNKKEIKSLSKVCLKKSIEPIDDRKKYKTMSKRRYYQKLKDNNSKEKINKNNLHVSFCINNINASLDNERKSNKYFNTTVSDFNILNDKYNTNYMKDLNNTNTYTNINKTVIKKENESQDNQDNTEYIEFENNEEFQLNLVSQSRINSIINKDNENNILYNPIEFDELIKNCNIPIFELNDYIYKDSIGEGSYGTIYEVEEKKNTKKICY